MKGPLGREAERSIHWRGPEPMLEPPQWGLSGPRERVPSVSSRVTRYFMHTAFHLFSSDRFFRAAFLSTLLLAVFLLAVPGHASAQSLDPPVVEEALKKAETGHDIQLDLPGVDSPVKGASTPETPDLPEIDADFSGFFEVLGVIGQVLFWLLVAGVIGLVVFLLIREAPFVADWLARRKARKEAATDDAAVPAEAPIAPHVARSLLEEADRLAAAGKYIEAVRMLLFRSVEDIAQRLGRRVPPALTSREILAAAPLADTARDAFDDIVSAVEISYFGDQLFGADDFQRCRASYERFALGGAAT